MRIRTAATAAAFLAVTLVGCSSDTDDAAPKATTSSESSVDAGALAKAAGMPPKPTGTERQELLDALAKVNPDIVKDADEAVDAARNQCSSINGGSERLDWSASQRFTYRDVVTTEAQGKQINEALKDIGFCDV